MDEPNGKRSEMRQPITLKIKFKSASLDQFIERYSVDVSKGGIFIRTKEPLAVGTQLKFEFQLQDSSSLISGEGTVVWIREHDPSRAGVAPGMGVRFDKLATASGTVLDSILVEKTRRGEAQVESRFDAGVRANVSVAGAIATRKANDFEPVDSRSGTPLPKPSPGFDGAEEEFREESTRVMQDDIVQRLAEKTRDKPAARDEQFSDEPTRARSVDEINELVRASGRLSSPSVDVPERESTVSFADVMPDDPVPGAPVIVPAAMAPVSPPSVSVADLPPAPVAASAPAELSQVKPTSEAETYREERPPTRGKSSGGLGLLLGAGVLGAAAVCYFVMSDKPTVVTPSPPPVIAPIPAPVEPAKAIEPSAPLGATVDVTSTPPGATVTLDGAAQPAVTPTKLTGLDDKKTYDVTLALKGHHDWKGKLSPGKDTKLETTLVANEKVVVVTSMPPGADVVLDGKKVGRTPVTIKKFDVSAAHQLELHHAGYLPSVVPVTATDAWATNGEGRDVLTVAVPLGAEPPKAKPVAVPKHVAQKPAGPATPAVIGHEGKGTDTPVTDTPVPEKPVAEKPLEKPVEKPVEAPKPKPVEDDRSIKTPSFMKDKPADSTGEGAQAP